MSSFKISKKNAHVDPRMSIIAKHDITLQEIEDDKKNIEKYKSELKLLYKLKSNVKFNRYLDEKIYKLEEKIYNIDNDKDISEYLFKSIDFLKEIGSEESKSQVSNGGEIFKYISLNFKNNKEELYRSYMAKCFPNELNETNDSIFLSNKSSYICHI